MSKQPELCPYCLQAWNREAVIKRRSAMTEARRADVASRTPRPKPVTRRPGPVWLGRVDFPRGDSR